MSSPVGAKKAKVLQEKMRESLTRLVLGGVGLVDLVVKPHVGHGHPVLGQGARLVGADGGGGAQRLHSLQVLHQAVLTSHSFSRQRQTHLRAEEARGRKGGVDNKTPGDNRHTLRNDWYPRGKLTAQVNVSRRSTNFCQRPNLHLNPPGDIYHANQKPRQQDALKSKPFQKNRETVQNSNAENMSQE